jgi:hypothetical protein
MTLTILIDLIAIIGLIGIAQSKGLEAALPFASFLLVLVPIEAIIPLGVFNLTTQRLIVVILLLLYFSSGRSRGLTGDASATPLKFLMLMHIAWCFVSTANSIVPVMSIKKALSVVFEYYTLYFIYWRTVSKVQTIHKILTAIVLAIIVCSVFGAVEAYSGWNVLQLLPKVLHHWSTEEADREVRVQSTFDHAILFGAALAMAITLALYLLTVVRKAWQKVFLWGGLMLMFLNIYKTSSRGPWLDVILGCLLLLFFAAKQTRKSILMIGVLSLLVMIIRPGIWGTIDGIWANTFNMNTDTGASYEYRYALPRAATGALLKSPGRTLWGYGLESFYDLGIEGEFLGKPHVFLSCDNAWVELMVETGFVGLLIIALLLLKPAWIAWREYWKLPASDRQLSLILLVNMLIFYFQMYSVGMYSWGQNGYMLWVLIALTLAHGKCREGEAERSASRGRGFSTVELEAAFQTT